MKKEGGEEETNDGGCTGASRKQEIMMVNLAPRQTNLRPKLTNMKPRQIAVLCNVVSSPLTVHTIP